MSNTIWFIFTLLLCTKVSSGEDPGNGNNGISQRTVWPLDDSPPHPQPVLRQMRPFPFPPGPPVQPVCPIRPPGPRPLPVIPPPPPCPPSNPIDDLRTYQRSFNKIHRVGCGTNKYTVKRSFHDVLTKDTQRRKRVVGGQISPEGMWPWTVALIQIPTIGSPSHFCGGSLIGDRWVLTAAHCVVNIFHTCQLKVQIGENTIKGLSNDRQVIGVEKIISHAQFIGPERYPQAQQYQNDIALLKLPRRVTLGPDANTICLPHARDRYNPASCTIIGWGKTWFGSQTSNHLLHLQIGQLHNQRCQMDLIARNHWGPGKICIPTIPGKDACHGDSGGPMACKSTSGRWILTGVTSHGTGKCIGICGFEVAPTVYSDVAYHIRWIEDVISRNGGA